MAKPRLDQLTAWMIGIVGTGAIFGAGYGLYRVAVKAELQHRADKVASIYQKQMSGSKKGEAAPSAVSPPDNNAVKPEIAPTKGVEGRDRAAWTYAGSSGPEKWATVSDSFKLCGSGRNQSPVDISETHTDKKALPISFFYGPSRVKLRNTGNNIEGVFSTPSNHISVDGERFDLVQFNFHTPAEHRLQDATLAFEMQLVHRTDANKLAVIAILFNSGETNQALAEVFRKMPEDPGSEAPDSINFNPMSIIPKRKAYYTYSGSLTTPPCTEGVTWLVMQTQQELALAQYKKFLGIIGKNARPVQRIGSRRIKLVPL